MAPRLLLQQLPMFPDEWTAWGQPVPIGPLRPDWQPFADLHKLTLKERQVGEKLRFNKTDKEISKELGMAKQTVNVHLGHVRSKLNARDRTGIAMLVMGADCDCHPGWGRKPLPLASRQKRRKAVGE